MLKRISILAHPPQEQQHLALEAQGHAPAAIAQHLGVDLKTVYQYRHRLRARLGLGKDVDLARWNMERLQG